MSTSQVQRDQWQQAARAGSWLPGPLSSGAIMKSFVGLIDDLAAAHVRLVRSCVRIGSSVAYGSRTAAPASAPSGSEPAPVLAPDSIEARAYEIFVQRGGKPGNPVDDWRRAETELRGEATG